MNSLLAVVEFIFEDFWRFLQCCILLMIISLWHPIEVNVMNGYWKERGKDDENDV